MLDGLFADVAAAGIFKDFKEFADAVPTESPLELLSQYRAQRPTTTGALRNFVLEHFQFADGGSGPPAPPPGLPLTEHIARLWPHLTRRSENPAPYSSALALPQPFVVPGGRFHELYYWDSYFTMLGFGAEQRQLRSAMIADFSYELHRYGHIPNGNRSYYLSRSQPPFFFKMLSLTSPGAEAKAFARFLPELKIEYAYWMDGANAAAPRHPVRHVVMMPDRSLLNRYWDERDTPRDESYPVDLAIARMHARSPQRTYRDIRAAAESGWDFSSRWLADRKSLASIETTDIVPSDLNSILFGLERAISEGCTERRDNSCADEFERRAERRRKAMNRYLWNGRWFDDYRWTDNRRLSNVSAAALYPLFFSVASQQQAGATAELVRARLLGRGGLITTTVATGQQWDAPNGWAPLQWIAVVGLRNYGMTQLAHAAACRWLSTVSRVYRQTGRLVEKYDVVSSQPGSGGEYSLQDGFGWTNGVTVALIRLYPDCLR